MQWLTWLLFIVTLSNYLLLPSSHALRIRPRPRVEYDSPSRDLYHQQSPNQAAVVAEEDEESQENSKNFKISQQPRLHKRIFASGFYVEPSARPFYTRERATTFPSHPEELKTEIIYDDDDDNDNESEYEERDSQEPTRPTTPGRLDSTTEEYYESSTTKYPYIPAALRRNFGRYAETTTSTEEPPTSPPLKKVKSGRRRKIKRPTASKLKQTTPKNKSGEDDLGIPENMDVKKESGDKNLALEIVSNDGKYALIDKFFDQTNVKVPGLISYSQSNDFNHDNEKTLGNVQQNDIWLSEGDLLVLRGGSLDASAKESWKPIDAYERDTRRPPLRIPLNSNNPPPFPVFTNKSGPPVFIGEPPPFYPYPPPPFGGNESFDPSLYPPPGMIPLYPNGTLPDYPPGPFPGPYPGPPGGGIYDYPPPVGGNGSYPPPPGGLYPYPPPPGGNFSGPPPPFFPFGPPPPGSGNGTFPHFLPPPPGFNPNFTGGGPGGPPPGFPLAPPLVLNPADNETDDPSIFLPPPYDFDYHEDNDTLVPPGPFAPGLVVPPPREFYLVYNRTENSLLDDEDEEPTEEPVTFQPEYFTPPYKKNRPQRPNDRKPNFPITVRTHTSLDEIFPQTTPYPKFYPESPKPMKKKKQRPGKFIKGIFNPKYSHENSFEEVPDTDAPAIALPDPGQDIIQMTPQPPSILSHQQNPNQVSPLQTTQKPLNYVYIRGQLKTLQELEEEEEDDEQPFHYLSTPRPPYDEQGYPTRDLNEHVPPTYIIQYPVTPPSPPQSQYTPKQLPSKVEQKEPPTSSIVYNRGGPGYSPNPVYNSYQIVEQEPEDDEEEEEESDEEQNGITQPIRRPTPPPKVITNISYPPPQSIASASPPPHPHSPPVQPHHQHIQPQEPIYNHNHINHQQQNDNLHFNQLGAGGGGGGHQGRVVFDPEHYQVVPVGPNYLLAPGTTTTNTGEVNRPQPHPPQHHFPSYNPISSVSYKTGGGRTESEERKPQSPPHPPQSAGNPGFRPAFAPPQQPQHNQHNHPPSPPPVYHQQQPQPQLHPQPQQQHNKQQGGRVLFPGQGIPQYINPLFNSRAPSLFQQGFYSPLSQFQQAFGGGGPGSYGFFQNHGPGPGPSFQPIINRNPQQQPNLQQQQQIFRQHPIEQQQQQQQRQRIPFIYQPEQQQQRPRGPSSPARGYNSQLTGFIQNQPVPLHRDILVNYREPLPQYNTESESITIRSVGKAGPTGVGGSHLSGKILSGKSPSDENGNFYSFQRGGPGGFSYKIRL